MHFTTEPLFQEMSQNANPQNTLGTKLSQTNSKFLKNCFMMIFKF